jgi:hypothetical protein
VPAPDEHTPTPITVAGQRRRSITRRHRAAMGWPEAAVKIAGIAAVNFTAALLALRGLIPAELAIGAVALGALPGAVALARRRTP